MVRPAGDSTKRGSQGLASKLNAQRRETRIHSQKISRRSAAPISHLCRERDSVWRGQALVQFLAPRFAERRRPSRKSAADQITGLVVHKMAFAFTTRLLWR